MPNINETNPDLPDVPDTGQQGIPGSTNSNHDTTPVAGWMPQYTVVYMAPSQIYKVNDSRTVRFLAATEDGIIMPALAAHGMVWVDPLGNMDFVKGYYQVSADQKSIVLSFRVPFTVAGAYHLKMEFQDQQSDPLQQQIVVCEVMIQVVESLTPPIPSDLIQDPTPLTF